MKTDFLLVIFTEESRATFDGPDRWAKNGFYPIRRCLWLKNGNKEVVGWAGIVEHVIIGQFKVNEGVKLNSLNNCDFMDKTISS